METVSTTTAERRLRLKSSYVNLAEAQYASPVIAAKLMVNLLRNSNADNRVLTQHLRTRLTIPLESSLAALSTAARTILTIATNNPEKHIVPKDGPKAFLEYDKHKVK